MVVSALVQTVGWYLVAPRAFRALLGVLSSPLAVLSLCGVLCYIQCLFSLALGWLCFWPALSAALVSCGVGAVAAALRGSSSFSFLCLSFTCSGEPGCWSQSFGPFCCSCLGCSWGLWCSILSPWPLVTSFLLLFRLGFLPLVFVQAGWEGCGPVLVPPCFRG